MQEPDAGSSELPELVQGDNAVEADDLCCIAAGEAGA
jgi:hypothetical protein